MFKIEWNAFNCPFFCLIAFVCLYFFNTKWNSVWLSISCSPVLSSISHFSPPPKFVMCGKIESEISQSHNWILTDFLSCPFSISIPFFVYLSVCLREHSVCEKLPFQINVCNILRPIFNHRTLLENIIQSPFRMRKTNSNVDPIALWPISHHSNDHDFSICSHHWHQTENYLSPFAVHTITHNPHRIRCLCSSANADVRWTPLTSNDPYILIIKWFHWKYSPFSGKKVWDGERRWQDYTQFQFRHCEMNLFLNSNT